MKLGKKTNEQQRKCKRVSNNKGEKKKCRMGGTVSSRKDKLKYISNDIICKQTKYFNEKTDFRLD